MYHGQSALTILALLWCFVGSLGLEVNASCVDAIGNCAAYGHAACTQYHAWAQDNCPSFCAFCTSSGQPSSQNGEACADVIDNCAALGPNVCTDYVEFAHVNCQKTCNLCSGASGGAAQCQDKLTNCEAYGQSACVGQYVAWARDNCPHYCNLCPSSSGGSGQEGFSDVCYYNGKAYKEGDQWTDGCDKNCTCVDQSTGYYLCQNLSMCATYNDLPAECQMVKPPGECCAKPQCPQQTGCVYKGQAHAEGEQWKDGCDYLCTCKDGVRGYYECRALCINWNLLPSCHLDNPAPGLCCSTPNCPSNVVIHYPDGYVPM